MMSPDEQNIGPEQCSVIAQVMCEVTEEILWRPVVEWAQRKKPGVSISFKVGTGLKTYHAHRPTSLVHTITFGREMVRDKLNPLQACGWLSAREIMERNYYDGRISILNLLSHTCLHEFAHFVQVLCGWRLAGSVHNDDFYRILDRMHRSDRANRVRHELNLRTRQQGVVLPHLPLIEKEDIERKQQIQVGELVRTAFKGESFLGRVVRIGRTNCTVDGIGAWEGVRLRGSKLRLEVIDLESDFDLQ